MVTSRPARNPNENKAVSRENAQTFNTEAFTWKLGPEDFDGNDGLDRDHVLGPLRGLLVRYAMTHGHPQQTLHLDL